MAESGGGVPKPAAPTLLTLPAEIRLRIWEYSLIGRQHVSAPHAKPYVPGALRACRQIRHEAMKMFYLESALVFHVIDFDGAFVEDFLNLWNEIAASVTTTADLKLTQFFMYNTGVPNWPNLLAWLKAKHTGTMNVALVPTMTPYSPTAAILAAGTRIVQKMHHSAWEDVEDVLEALHLAISAHDPAWI